MAEIAFNGELNLGVEVADLDRVIDWYGHVLGFGLQQRMDQIGFAILGTSVPGVVFGLSRTDQPRGTRGVGITWGVSDIERARAALAMAGVDVGEVRDIPGVVRLLDFSDPDGNRLTFWAEPV